MLKPPARFLEMVAVRETSPSDIWDEDDIWENSHTKKKQEMVSFGGALF